MRTKIFLVLLALLLFSAIAFAQACYNENQEEREFSHPTDGSLYFVAMDKEFVFKSSSNNVFTYEKGTTRLLFKTSSFVTATTSDPKAFARILLSEYNNSDAFTKLNDLTDTTVGEYTAYYLKYKDKASNDFGRITAIIGPRADTKTKIYTINLRAKEARFDQEEQDYLDLLGSFSLSPLSECVAEPPPEEPPEEPPVSTPPVTPPPTEPPDNNVPDNNPPADNNTPPPSTQNNPPQSNEDSNSFTILGFDGVLVIAGIILLLLLLGIGAVGLIIMGVVVYFFFIKKKR